jgi:WD40 repeat protein
MATGEALRAFDFVSRAGASGLAFSPDSRTIYGGDRYGLGRLWDIQTGRQTTDFVGHTDNIWSARFSRDGRFILTSSDDNTARVWDAGSAQELRRITLPFALFGGDFSPDGKNVLLEGSNDRVYLLPAGVQDTVDELCSRLVRDFTPEERQQYAIADDAATCPNLASSS